MVVVIEISPLKGRRWGFGEVGVGEGDLLVLFKEFCC